MEQFELIRSKRKTISIAVTENMRVIVRAPLTMRNETIRKFVEKNRAWIEKNLQKQRELREKSEKPFTAEEIRALADAASGDIPARVARYAPVVGVTVGRITIRSQKSRWGSCSAKGNLNFNCLLMLCPEDVRDYVVVHELCHRKELNHSLAFWSLVENVLPGYREQYRWLRENGGAIIRRLGR